MKVLLLLIVTVIVIFLSLLRKEGVCQGILKEHRLSEKDTEQRIAPRGEMKKFCK